MLYEIIYAFINEFGEFEKDDYNEIIFYSFVTEAISEEEAKEKMFKQENFKTTPEIIEINSIGGTYGI